MSIDVRIADLQDLLMMAPDPKGMHADKRDAYWRLAGAVMKAREEIESLEPTHFRILWPSELKVSAIKALRTINGMGLKEAKDAVEANEWIPMPPGPDPKHRISNALTDAHLNLKVEYQGRPPSAAKVSVATPGVGTW